MLEGARWMSYVGCWNLYVGGLMFYVQGVLFEDGRCKLDVVCWMMGIVCVMFDV